MSLMILKRLGLFYHRVAKLFFFLVFPTWFKMLGLALLVQARTAPSWLFWLSVTILIFLFASCFSSYSNSPWSSLLFWTSKLQGRGILLFVLFIWGWHYLAVELWDEVAFTPVEPCCSFCNAPLCVHLYCEGKGGLLLLLLFFSSHMRLSTLALCCWIFGDCHFPWRSPSTALCSLQHLGPLLCHPQLCMTVHSSVGDTAFG